MSELNRTLGCVRFVWNWALADRTRRYRTLGESVGYHQLSAELTVLKRTEAASFLSEVSAIPLQQVLRHQQTAFNNFFAKRARYPRFKTRNGHQSAELIPPVLGELSVEGCASRGVDKTHLPVQSAQVFGHGRL